MKCKEKDCNYQTNDSHLWIMHGQAHQIAALTRRLQEAEEMAESIVSIPYHAYGDNEAACSMVERAAAWLKGGTN